MPRIVPIRDLKNTTAISNLCHEDKEPIFVTKNGYGDMVVMSYEEYQNIQYEMMVMRELRAAELESETTVERFAHDKVMSDIRNRIKAVGNTHV